MISTIIINYFSSAVILKAIENLEAVHEIILIDNSVDSNEQHLLEKLAESNNHIIYKANTKNVGFAKAVNQGLAIATGDAILLLNPDAYLQKGTLEKLYNQLQEQKVAATGPLLQYPNGKEQAGGRRLTPTPVRAFAKLFGLSRLGLVKDHNLANTPLPKEPTNVEALSGACMMIRTDLFKELGGLDEAYVMHCEDLDLCMRLRQAGYKLMFLSDAITVHEKGYSSLQQPLWVAWHLHKGMLHYYKKFFRHQYPTPLWLLVKLGVYLRFIIIASLNITLRLFKK